MMTVEYRDYFLGKLQEMFNEWAAENPKNPNVASKQIAAFEDKYMKNITGQLPVRQELFRIFIRELADAISIIKTTTVDDELSETSENPVQNKVIVEELNSFREEFMRRDGGNYVSSLALVTPVISSTWKIKKQDGTVVSTSTNNNTTVENGAKVDYSGTSSQPTPSASQTAPTAISGDFGTSASGSKTATDITTGTQFRVTYTAPKSGLEVSGTKVVKASGNQQTSASASVAFSHRRYWGASTYADADITKLTTELSNSKAKTIDFNCSGGKYFYYAYPKALGSATWKVGGLAFTGYQLTEKTITNEYGLPVAYYIYRSSNLQTGSSINAVIS